MLHRKCAQTSHLEDHQPPVGVSMHSVGDVGTGMTSGGSPWQILHGFSLLYLWWRLEWSHQGRNHDSLQTQCAFESPTTKENKRMTINNLSRCCQVSSEDEIISDWEALAWSERTRNISCSNQNTHLTQFVSFGPITQIAITANL